MLTTTARTRDGRLLPVVSTGRGPGVVVVHGAAVTSSVYRRLARVLGESVPVHLYDRHPGPEPYQLADDVDALQCVLEHTGAQRLLGHSYGGMLALRVSRRMPLERVAVYDAGVSVDGSFPAGVVEPFAAAVRDGDLPRAATVLSRELRLAGPVSGLPASVQLRLARLAARTAVGRSWLDALASAAPELRAVVAGDGPARDLVPSTAELLLGFGDRSPAFFARAARALAAARPGTAVLELPRARHDAIVAARRRHVTPFARFLAG